MMRFLSQWLWLCLGLNLISAPPIWANPSIFSNTLSISTDLPLDGQGNTNTRILKIATITLSTDNSNGYTATITSGDISKAGGTPISIQVTTVPADNAPPSSGDFQPSGSLYTISTNQAGTENRDLYIRYSSLPYQDPGNYSGTISLTISDNP